MEDKEQPEGEVAVQPSDDDLGIEAILAEGLKGQETKPEDSSQPSEEPLIEAPIEEALEVEQAEPVQAPAPKAESLFTELVIGEQKIPFKTEDEFSKFIESNQTLKDGFSMQSDYTRKTQELAEQRKEFEQKQEQLDKGWGPVRPDESSMKNLNEAWYGYQVATPQQAEVIAGILEDAGRLGRGEAPTGMLAKLTMASNDQVPPEYQKLQQDYTKVQTQLNRMEMEKKREAEERTTSEQKQSREKAEAEVSKWIEKKRSDGVTVVPEEFQVMSGLSNAVNNVTKKPYTLDELYGLARAQLGKTDADAVKKVIATTKEKKARTVSPPSSRASANASPEPDSIEDILEQGVKELQEN